MSAEENKRISRIYHELKQEDVETILTPDFIGRHPNGYTWDRETHKGYVTNDVTDTIHMQIAENDWVATQFTRTGTMRGNPLKLDGVHLKRFRDGKIAEVQEYFDPRQLPWFKWPPSED